MKDHKEIVRDLSSRDFERARAAYHRIVALGPEARSLVPALESLVDDPGTGDLNRWAALRALAAVVGRNGMRPEHEEALGSIG